MSSASSTFSKILKSRLTRFTSAVLLLCAIVVFGMSACTTTTTERLNLPPLESVEKVELERYLGKWYELASYPQSFQEGCERTTATYSLKENGDILVINRCWRDGDWDEAEGNAVVEDKASNSKLSVCFFWPFYGDYWIISLAQDYSWAVVGHPSRDYLWILSRTPSLPNSTLDQIYDEIENKHLYPMDRLNTTVQTKEH